MPAPDPSVVISDAHDIGELINTARIEVGVLPTK
jgi:hypothetical protein